VVTPTTAHHKLARPLAQNQRHARLSTTSSTRAVGVTSESRFALPYRTNLDGVWGAGKSAQRARGGSSVRRAADFSIPGVDEEEAWFRHGNDQEDQDQEVEKKKEKKKKEKKKKGDGAVNGAATDTTTVSKKWSKLKDSLRPTQTALGWDWVLYKMKNLLCEETAQEYLDRKPVPVVKRGEFYYVIDHHHTLAALEASGWDVKVTIVVVQDIPEDLAPLEFFWNYMEKRGMCFIRNVDYTHASVDKLPLTFNMTEYNNDVYRSMGGFARLNNVLKRPKNLQARLFFEFKWGYFFNVHQNDDLGLWHDKRLFRSWCRAKQLIEETDMQEYMLDDIKRVTIPELIYLSENVIEPAYTLMMFYLRSLCTEYESLSDEDKVKMCPRMADMFGEGNEKMPEGCIVDNSHMYMFSTMDEGELDENDDAEDGSFEEDNYGDNDDYGDESDFRRWSLPSSLVGLLGSPTSMSEPASTVKDAM